MRDNDCVHLKRMAAFSLIMSLLD